MKIINTIFIICMFIFLAIPIVFASDSENLFLSTIVEYNQGNVSIKEVQLIQATEQLNKIEKEGNYALNLYSFKNEVLYQTKFNFELTVLSEPPKEWFDKEGNQIYIPNETEKSKLSIDKISKVIFIPYFKTMKTLKILDVNDNEVTNKDVSEFAVCNLNSICDNKETRESCSEDCLYKSNYKPVSFWGWISNLFKRLFSWI